MKETRGVGIHAYLLVGLACQLRVTSLDPQVRAKIENACLSHSKRSAALSSRGL